MAHNPGAWRFGRRRPRWPLLLDAQTALIDAVCCRSPGLSAENRHDRV
jgi:hypothetical protein